jgi:hypothetical protein
MTDVLWVLAGLILTWAVSLVAALAVATEFYYRITQQLKEIKGLMPSLRPPAWAQELLQQLQEIKKEMRSLVTLVQIEDTNLAAFAATVENEVTAITAAVGVLQGYIAQLLAGQGTPLPAADESVINQALTDLGASVGTLNALEPPAPPTP